MKATRVKRTLVEIKKQEEYNGSNLFKDDTSRSYFGVVPTKKVDLTRVSILQLSSNAYHRTILRLYERTLPVIVNNFYQLLELKKQRKQNQSTLMKDKIIKYFGMTQGQSYLES